jgi:arabinogalactan oligomer/maltooligosaccharide transport system permease protein
MELESKFNRGINGKENFNDLISFKNLSSENNPLFEIIIDKETDWKAFLKKAFLPRFQIPEFYVVFFRTIIWTSVNVFFHFSIGLGFALLLNKKIAFRSGYRLLLLIPWGVPSVVSAFSWRWLFNYDFGFINWVIIKLGGAPLEWLSDPTLMLIAAIITNIWLGYPFMTITLLGGLQTIPNELYESSRVDGANVFQQFFNITMPLLKPVALTVTLLGIIWTFNMFNVIYLVTQASVEADILVTYAYRAAFRFWDIGESTAYSVLILCLLLSFCYSYWKVLKGEKGIY